MVGRKILIHNMPTTKEEISNDIFLGSSSGAISILLGSLEGVEEFVFALYTNRSLVG